VTGSNLSDILKKSANFFSSKSHNLSITVLTLPSFKVPDPYPDPKIGIKIESRMLIQTGNKAMPINNTAGYAIPHLIFVYLRI
jgi:hypothetical protein